MSETNTEEGKAVAIAGPTNGNLLQAVIEAARDPSITPEKMMGLIDVNERLMRRQAEIDFNIAFGKLQKELSQIRIKKNGIIAVNGQERSRYAKYEDIDNVVRPLLNKYGFFIRFSSVPESGKLVVRGTLSHENGHSIDTVTPMTIDANPKFMNGQQAIGSASSYAQRYILKMLLNLVFEGEDDDGQSAGYCPISEDQAAELKELIRETGTSTVGFLVTMVSGVTTVDDIGMADFDRVRNTLLAKRNKQRKTDA